MKNIIIVIISMLVWEMICEYLCLVYLWLNCVLYFLCLEIINEEMIGEKLKENIMMEMFSYIVIRMLL